MNSREKRRRRRRRALWLREQVAKGKGAAATEKTLQRSVSGQYGEAKQ